MYYMMNTDDVMKSSLYGIESFLMNLYNIELVPSLTQIFRVENNGPTIDIDQQWFNTDRTISGEVFINVTMKVYKMGIIHMIIIYNINHDSANQQQFTRIILESIDGISEDTVSSLLLLIIKLANRIKVKLINVNDVNKITPHIWTDVDLLMILYTGQSVYGNLGFIQLSYPKMMSEIQMLLYTPLSELLIPEDMFKSIISHFGVSETDTLTTLFFVVYPLYIQKTCTEKDNKQLIHLYKFLTDTNKTVETYTRTMMYVPFNQPAPGNVSAISLEPQYNNPYPIGNLYALLNQPDIWAPAIRSYNTSMNEKKIPKSVHTKTVTNTKRKHDKVNTGTTTRRL